MALNTIPCLRYHIVILKIPVLYANLNIFKKTSIYFDNNQLKRCRLIPHYHKKCLEILPKQNNMCILNKATLAVNSFMCFFIVYLN